MIKVKKILLSVILGVLVIQNSFFVIVFAAEDDDIECRTCTMSSLEFQTYINFQVEMLEILQGVGNDDLKIDGNREAGLFSSDILHLKETLLKSWSNMFKSETKKLVKTYESVKMGAIMLGSIVTEIVTKDSLGGLQILFRNKVFVRERKTLQNVDMSIHDTMRDMGMKGVWNKKVSSDIKKDMLDLKNKYTLSSSNEYGLFEKFNIMGDIKYKDIVYILLKLNSVMKGFVSTYSGISSSDLFLSFSTRVAKDISKGNLIIKFNNSLMESMFDSYKCAEGWGACDNMLKDFVDNTSVWKQISQGFENSMDIINTANDELREAMLGFGNSVNDTFDNEDNNSELGLTPKQLTLLRTVYGIDTTKLSQGQGIGFKKTIFAVTHPGQMINDMKLKPLDYFSAENVESREVARKLKKQLNQDEKYLMSLSASGTKLLEDQFRNREMEKRSIKDMRKSLQDTLDTVFIQRNEDENIILVYSNLAITQYFVQIGGLIHDIVEETIGTKESKGLVKYLGDTCESQCVNKGTNNCYAR